MASILGLNAYHGDSSACLIRDGRLVAAAEEERFRRVKHWAGLPTQAVDFCLREAGLKLADVDHIAINRKPGVHNLRRLLFILGHRPDPRLVWQKLSNIRSAVSVKGALEAAVGQPLKARFHLIEHHQAHLASAFLVSGFEEAVCVSIDGFGDFASTAVGFGRGKEITIDRRVFFPHSLGLFYTAVTQFLGFLHFGDEYKVMGLAPYGEPKFLDQMRRVVLVQPDGSFRLNLRYFRHHTDNVAYSWKDCSPEFGTVYTDALADLLGPPRDPKAPLEQRHKDLARSVQAMYEEAFFALLNAAYRKTPCPNLALAGGCAMNSVANGKVYLNTPFKRMYLPAAAGDAGGAIGAAYCVLHEVEPRAARQHLDHAYSGPQFSGAEVAPILEAQRGAIDAAGCTVELLTDEDALCARTARAITEGKVIGWFQGRMEWGPRALGNRSILGDPRRADMKDILNRKIKRRESFRPFAPSVLREAVADWFEQDDDVPFMMEVFQIRPEKRATLLAVTHVDGSGRLQTVHRETNGRYHRLIRQFEALTGVPMVLNTSFNENEPVVCRPQEALDCFLRTNMDVLVLGDHFLERRSAAPEQ